MEREIPRRGARLLARRGRSDRRAGVPVDGLGRSIPTQRPPPAGQHQFHQASINFITAHDGFTLCDLVSYNQRHNQANLENNQDGDPHNRSWNCGVEGPTKNPKVLALRQQQRRNFLATLLLSQGVPMLLAGDEVGRTQRGNNNAYCQDSELSWFDWDLGLLDDNRELLAFVQRLVRVRQRHPIFRRRHFFRGIQANGLRDILWFNPDGREINYDEWTHDHARCLGMYLPGTGLGDWDKRGYPLEDDDFLLLFNAHHEKISFVLPINFVRVAHRARQELF